MTIQEQIQGFRLSPHQQRLWSLQGDSPAYCSQCAVLLQAENIRALRQVVHQVVSRHEILRTTFHILAGMKVPVQVVSQDVMIAWDERDLSPFELKQQRDAIDECFYAERHKPFDFKQGPLLRVALLKLSGSQHALVMTIPALCGDLRSLKIIVREISALYAGVLADEQRETSIQYAQFAEWLNQLLEDDDAEAGREFWRKRDLSDSLNAKLPFEKRRAKQDTFDPSSIALTMGRDLTDRIRAVSQKYETSPRIFLITCLQTLLWRLTGQREIVVGSACDCRDDELLCNTAGLITRLLPARATFELDARFSEILASNEKLARDADDWREYFSLDESVARGGAASEPSYFPAAFEFEGWPEGLSENGSSFSFYKLYNCSDKFALKLSCAMTRDSLGAEFHYDSGTFHKQDVERIARNFETLLTDAVGRAEALAGDLEILSRAEMEQLLIAFNSTSRPYPKSRCVHQLLEEQVERTPDRIAVVFEEDQLSYAALNSRANQVAHLLRNLGVGCETLVGLCAERSVEMIIGLWAILKAGGAYVPVDPSYPKQRLKFIIDDARITVLLTQRKLLSSLNDQKTQLICLDGCDEERSQESSEDPAVGVTAENLAYVIYTSGSTGKPKGVMIQHRSLVNLTGALNETVYSDRRAGLRVGLSAPLAFDASIKQVVQLTQGHSLYIVPEDARLDGRQLTSYMDRHCLDVLDCTPSQLWLLLQTGLTQDSSGRPSQMLVGGEAIDDTTWSVMAGDPRTTFYNVYGPTECTVDSAACVVSDPGADATIGRPLANTRAYVLDHQRRPVPIGVGGELHIGGDGLARGYLGEPGWTAERFLPDPFSGESGARMYKTGDVVSYLTDGNLRFIGRTDDQVKVRGFRIELGEIEAALRQFAGTGEAVVIVREDAPGDKRLVAYVAPKPQATITTEQLREFLSSKLPDYMIPSALVFLTDIPITRNGKVDRQALPAPESARPDVKAEYVPPRNNAEQVIAGIWEEILRLEKVGINDNYFDLGGHSLLMVRLHSKLRATFHKDVPMVELFRNPTVSLQARYFSDEHPGEPSVDQAQNRAGERRKAMERQSELASERRRRRG